PPRPPLFPYTTLFRSLSFLEIDCVEFRHLEVNGAPAVFFDLVVRLRREVTVEPTSNGQGAAATVPRRTPKQITGEAPSISPASRSEEHTSELQSRGHL